MKKKYIIMVSLSVILTLLLGIGVSYSLWNINVSQNNVNTAMTSCFDIIYSSESNAINLEKQYPISDEAGSKLTPYTFKITNNCDINAYYKINLETLNTSNIDTRFIKTSLNNTNPQVINRYNETEVSLKNGKVSNTLKSGYLPVGGSVSFDLRVWLDYDTTINDIKNDGTDKWGGKIVVISSPVTEDEINKVCQSNGGDLIDDGECRKYYVKLNNAGKPKATKLYKLLYNNDGSITASTDGLTYTNGSIYVHLLRNVAKINHYYLYKINILSIYERWPTTSANVLDITQYTYKNGNEYWPKLQHIVSTTDTGNYTGYFITNSINDSLYIESYKWAEFTFRDAMVIDLTLMFGEGNEPNGEWCDKYLDRYIEYNLEGTLIPIKELGEPIKTAYYDKVDMFD